MKPNFVNLKLDSPVLQFLKLTLPSLVFKINTYSFRFLFFLEILPYFWIYWWKKVQVIGSVCGCRARGKNPQLASVLSDLHRSPPFKGGMENFFAEIETRYLATWKIFDVVASMILTDHVSGAQANIWFFRELEIHLPSCLKGIFIYRLRVSTSILMYENDTCYHTFVSWCFSSAKMDQGGPDVSFPVKISCHVTKNRGWG